MYYLACDIGASSGRHIIGKKTADGRIELQEIYRFENECAVKNGHFCWDVTSLFRHVLDGLIAAKPYAPVSFGIDTWAVDFVLLDADDQIIGDTVAYRDNRTHGMHKALEERLTFMQHYQRTGIAKQPFNTVYQLMTIPQEDISKANTFLMIPDYLHFLLTGRKPNEYTNASSTALLNAQTRTWDYQVLRAAHIPEHLFSDKPVMPGTVMGRFLPEIETEIGYSCHVVLPATHDTGSAFMAIPTKDDHAVCISSGTWSLLGLELDAPLLDAQSHLAGFTNEGGYDGKIRYLKNIMGLWILQCVRKEQGKRYSYAEMAEMAQQNEHFNICFDANDARFLAPENMINEIKSALLEEEMPLPQNDGELFACIHHSLALCYRSNTRFSRLSLSVGAVLNVHDSGNEKSPRNLN